MVRKAGKKKIRRLPAALLFAVLLLCPLLAFGAGRHVFDGAELFSDEWVQQLEGMAQELEETYDMNILLLTTDDSMGYSSAAFAETFYEDGGYADNERRGGIVLLIDMDNREMNLVTNGDMIYYITDAREEAIYDAGYDYASRGKYEAAMYGMLRQTGEYLKSGIPRGQYTYDAETGKITRYRSVTFGDLLLAAGAALFLAGISCFTLKRRYNVVEKYDYSVEQNAKIQVTDRQDLLVNEFTTSRHVPTAAPPRSGGSRPSGRSGRTTVHRSSGGRSYGGGHGRKF